MILDSEVQAMLEEVFPDVGWEHKLALEGLVFKLLESKDIGRFKGELSSFKQLAIDTAASMPKPVMGRKALEKDAAKRLDRVVRDVDKEMSKLYKAFLAEKISKTKFKDKMKSVLRLGYLDAYQLGTRASGLVRATDLSGSIGVDEKRWLNNVYKAEMGYFNKLLSDLIHSKSKTKASTRIKNYSNAVRSVFDSSRILQLPDQVIIHWVLESDNPCPECILLQRLSPFTKFTLPTTPKAGATRCLSYCFCRLRVVKAKSNAEVLRVSRRNRSPQYLMKKLKQSRKKK